MSTCIDKLHTTYLKPFIFFKGVYRLLDGAWGRVKKVSLALLFPNQIVSLVTGVITIINQKQQIATSKLSCPTQYKMCVNGILNNYVCFIELLFIDQWHAIPVRGPGSLPLPSIQGKKRKELKRKKSQQGKQNKTTPPPWLKL